jgi:uracil-DNA glycosylase family 4
MMSPIDERRFTRLVREVRACTACDGMAHAHVLGAANGTLDARVLFVAEAVGRRGGAVTGVPLTRDVSGRRFAAFLAIAGIDRSDVFITNAVLCNPLDALGRNRPPTGREAARCRPFLARTLEAVHAPLVVVLGRVALESLRAIAPHDAVLSRDVATPLRWCGRTLVPMYHPGVQSTLHRPHAVQEDDWRRLGALARSQCPLGDEMKATGSLSGGCGGRTGSSAP